METTATPRGLTKAFARPKRGVRNATEMNRIRILRALAEQPHTCDELEQMLSLTHQTCSAVLRGMSRDRYIFRNGRERITRSGAYASVWSIPGEIVTNVEGGFAVEPPDIVEAGVVTLDFDPGLPGGEHAEVRLPIVGRKKVPRVVVPFEQPESKKLFYRAEICGGTDANPEIRTTLRLVYLGAIAEIYNMPMRPEFQEPGWDVCLGHAGVVMAGGHVTNFTPREELDDLIDDLIDFIADTQLSVKHPQAPVLEVTVSVHAPSTRIHNARTACFVFGDQSVSRKGFVNRWLLCTTKPTGNYELKELGDTIILDNSDDAIHAAIASHAAAEAASVEIKALLQ